MHTRSSNSELVEPLPEPERTLNRRLHRRNRRVPFNQRNNPPQNPRIVYPPILDINHFRHFLVILENLYPMDDEPMWAADRVVAPTPGSAITIPETANELAIKGNIIKIFYHGLSEITQEVLNAAAGGIFLYKTTNQAYQLLEDKFDRLADKQSGRPSGSLPSNTQPNPKGHNSKAYQPPQSRNEHVNDVFTRSGKSYNPPVNPNDHQENSETPYKFNSD
ncbi:hypothetical protein Tco_0116714 [Tanacetum coccineum]